jgi:archaellum component FlaC
MAARTKTTAKKKSSRTTKGKAGVSRLDRLTRDLPPTLREFSKQVQGRLNRLEKEIDRVQASYRKQIAHLIRVASHRLGQLEARGEGQWRRLAEPARKEAVRLLSQLEKAISPQTKQAKKVVREVKRDVEQAKQDVKHTAEHLKQNVQKAAATAAAAISRPSSVPSPSHPFPHGSDTGGGGAS